MAMEDRIFNLREAISILTSAQITLQDWYGPEGTKLSHAHTYLRQELDPLLEAMLADEVTA
jgi:hypothetical protein